MQKRAGRVRKFLCKKNIPLEKEVLCWKERKDVKIFSSQGNIFSNVNSYKLSHATTPFSRIGSKKSVLQMLSSGSSSGSNVLPGSDKVCIKWVGKEPE
jgi:hypothetical protein